MKLLSLCLFLSLVSPIQMDTTAPKYLLFSKVLEEINNSEMAVYQLLKWSKLFNVTIVEPFVCDSWIGGLPGWTFPPSSNYNRNISCTLKKYSWYRDIESVPLFTNMITYEEFVSQSTRCNQFSANIGKPNLSPSVGYGRCAEICVLDVMDADGGEDWFVSNGVRKEDHHFSAVDLFLKVDTGLYFVDVNFVRHSDTLIQDLFKKTEQYVSEGKCRTNSVVLHGLSKMWPKVIETDTTVNRYQFWENLSKELMYLEPSKELQKVSNFMKKNFLGNRYLVLLLRVLKTIEMHDAKMEAWEACFQSIVSKVQSYIKEHNVKFIFLASDVLVRDTTGEISPESEECARKAVKILLDSGIPMVTNLESDPFWLLSGNDRGASGIIDQKLAKNADFLISIGSGGFTRRVIQYRRENSLHTEILECSLKIPSSKINPSIVPANEGYQFIIGVSILIVCVLVLCVRRYRKQPK